MINEDYVSFDTAKLLKKKGFDWCESPFYSEQDRDEWRQNNSYTIPNMEYNPDYPFDSEVLTMVAPHVSIQMAMKWFEEVHNILLITDYDYECTDKSWCYKIYQLEEGGKPKRVPIEGVRYDSFGEPHVEVVAYRNYERSFADYATKKEACDAAIKYCLENLIKNEDEEEESDVPVPKTVDEAISTLEKILSDEDREYLLKNGAISMHDSLGRWIRNEWGLWTGSELKDEMMNMNKGLNHPDDMSNYIIEEFIKYWNNKT